MRLIDTDAIKLPKGFFESVDNVLKFYEWLNTLPTIDPVKHGEWIKMSDADGVYWACSECGEDIPRIAHYNPEFNLFPRLESIDKTNYCPHCGARMDSE